MSNVRIGSDTVLQDRDGRRLIVVACRRSNGQVIMDAGRRFVKIPYGKLQRDLAAGKYKVVTTGAW